MLIGTNLEGSMDGRLEERASESRREDLRLGKFGMMAEGYDLLEKETEKDEGRREGREWGRDGGMG